MASKLDYQPLARKLYWIAAIALEANLIILAVAALRMKRRENVIAE
jgi:hypothetical protein